MRLCCAALALLAARVVTAPSPAVLQKGMHFLGKSFEGTYAYDSPQTLDSLKNMAAAGVTHVSFTFCYFVSVSALPASTATSGSGSTAGAAVRAGRANQQLLQHEAVERAKWQPTRPREQRARAVHRQDRHSRRVRGGPQEQPIQELHELELAHPRRWRLGWPLLEALRRPMDARADHKRRLGPSQRHGLPAPAVPRTPQPAALQHQGIVRPRWRASPPAA